MWGDNNKMTELVRKQKIFIVCEHCEHIASFSDTWGTLHLVEGYECFYCGNKNGEKKRNYKYGELKKWKIK